MVAPKEVIWRATASGTECRTEHHAMTPLTDSTAQLNDTEALQAQAQAEGYVLVRELLPASDVETVGRQLGAIMARAGWIEHGRALGQARANLEHRCVEPQPTFMDVFYEQLSCKSLHALKMHYRLMDFFSRLFGEDALCVPHCVMRMAFPQMEAFATPAHQDITHFEGSRNNWAAWIPFTPIDEKTGGLSIASGSHRGPIYDMRPTLGAGQMVIDANLDGLDWRWSPMAPGDVLIHNCIGVHKGLPNRSETIRVSVDARYQPLSEPVAERCLSVPHQLRAWEDLYQGWDDDEYKYYWRHLDLEVVPFTFHWYDRRDRRAIEMGEAGDGEAAVALENITLKHRDPGIRARAAAALENLRES